MIAPISYTPKEHSNQHNYQRRTQRIFIPSKTVHFFFEVTVINFVTPGTDNDKMCES